MSTVLEKLSTEDLLALKKGDLSGVSTEGLKLLRAGGASAPTPAQNAPSTASQQPSGGAAAAGQVAPHAPTGAGVPEAANAPAPKPLKLGREALKEQWAEEPWYNQLIAGFGSAPKQAEQSIRQLAGQDVPEGEIKDWRMVADTPVGMAGNLGGNVAMLAIPGAKAESALNTAVRAAGPLRRTLTAMGLAGAENAALNPVLEGESRAMNAAIGAGAGAAAAAASRVLGGLVTPSPEAQQLMAKGIQPTVGQGGSGVLGKALGYGGEEFLHALPIVGQIAERGQNRAAREAVDVAARRASPYSATALPDATVGRGQYFTDLDKQFDMAYDTLLKGKTIPVNRLFHAGIRADVDRIMQGASPEARRELEKNLAQFVPSTVVGRVKGETWKEVQGQIRRLRAEEGTGVGLGDRDAKLLSQAYKAVDDKLKGIRDQALTKDEVAQLEAVDTAWSHAATLRKAASYPNQGDKGISMENFIRAVEARTPDAMKIKGTGRYQDITEPGRTVFGKKWGQDALERRLGNIASTLVLGGSVVGGAPGMSAIAPLLAVGALGTTRPGAKVIMGNTDFQRRAASLLRNKAGTIGAIGSGSLEE